MNKVFLPLSQASWEQEFPHKLVKCDATEGTRVRVVELERGYDEPGWCERSHVAYVVRGRLAMRFDSAVTTMNTGDVAVLAEGPAHRHRPEPLTEKVVLLLVESDTRSVVTPMGDVSVEGARASDLSEVMTLLSQNGLPEQGVAEAFEGFVVVRAKGQIVGTCGIEDVGEEGLLRSLAVRHDARRAGLGRLLVEEIRKRARYRGIKKLYLLTTTATDFFAHVGFAVTPRDLAPVTIRESWEFRTGCPLSATLMRSSS
jgi:amino-acid N-acetyltransferase